MKILNLSLDKSILDKNSKAAARIAEYGNLAEVMISSFRIKIAEK